MWTSSLTPGPRSGLPRCPRERSRPPFASETGSLAEDRRVRAVQGQGIDGLADETIAFRSSGLRPEQGDEGRLSARRVLAGRLAHVARARRYVQKVVGDLEGCPER